LKATIRIFAQADSAQKMLCRVDVSKEDGWLEDTWATRERESALSCLEAGSGIRHGLKWSDGAGWLTLTKK
jgi:hypothetical protein